MQSARGVSDVGERSLSALHRSSRAEVPNARFEQEFFGELRTLFGAEAVAVWFCPGNETLYLRHQQNLPTEELQRSPEEWQRHGRLLKQVVEVGKPRFVPPEWSADDAGNPTSLEILIAPAAVVGTQQVLLEVFRPRGRRNPAIDGPAELELLARAAEFAADRTRMGQLAGAARERLQLKSRDSFAQRIHSTLDPRKVAYIAANEGRDALGCDRVSVALGRGRSVRLAAVSGQPKPDRRANQVRLLESLVREVVAAGEPVVYGPGTRQAPDRAAHWLTAYLTDAKPATLFVIPMRGESGKRGIGALIVEQFDNQLTPEALVDGVNQTAAHTSLALQNALAHDRVFLGSIRRRIGTFFAETIRLRTLITLALLAAIVTAMIIVPWPLRMEGRGTLRADLRRGVFAPESGVVREVLVRHGDRVHAGQILARIENPELVLKLQEAREQLVSTSESLKLKQVQLSDRNLSPQKAIEVDGEIAQLNERRLNLNLQVSLLEQRIEPLTVRAPMNGVVATWQPERQLLNRPVNAGNLLLQIIEPEGAWTMELNVPESAAGYVLEAWRTRPEGSRLRVDYILATDPERRYRGWLSEISPRTEIQGDKHAVLMNVVPDPDDPPPLRDGAEVRGRILCGERPMGYIALREIIEFGHSRILFLF
ncbi:MAG: HlyD family efflux transporter periplasmic adaptor subunit [Planctomyces sp.]|nr:HlyD family efflux transporter periplasmic adaptor subunit [Planctomyces sp.]